MITWNEIFGGIEEAHATIRNADCHVVEMAEIIRGRLRRASVDLETLDELKRELANWNMHTHTWKG